MIAVLLQQVCCVIRLMLLLVLLGSVSVQAQETRSFSEIEYLADQDAAQALTVIREQWPDQEPTSATFERDLLMVYVLGKNKMHEQSLALSDAHLQRSDLTAAKQGLMLSSQISVYRNTKNTEAYQQVLQAARDLLPELQSGNPDEISRRAMSQINSQLGFDQYFQAQFALAEPYFLTALQHIDTSRHWPYSKLLNTIGVVYAQQAKMAEAAQYMMDSVSVLEDNGLAVTEDRYRNLGSLFFMLKEFDQSVEFSSKALSMLDKDSAAKASAASNLAAAYIELGQNDAAIQHLLESIDINTRLGVTTSTARNNLGYLYNDIGEYEKALEQLELSAAELDDVENAELKGVSFKSRADVHANMGNTQQAIEFYEQALVEYKKVDLKPKRIELYPKMVAVLEQTGNYQRAYEMMVEYKQLNDEINDVQATKELNEILTSFEVEKKERALVQSELEREKQQTSIELLNREKAFEARIRQLMYVIVGALLLVLLLVFRSLRYRGRVNQVLLDNNQRIEKQHLQLTELNEKLKTQAEIDSLTGLKNRRYLTQLVAEYAARDESDAKQWSLILIDIDDFKQINDRYGHQRGDEVLVKFAQALRSAAADEDVLARWGGEEFLWLARTENTREGSAKCQQLQQQLDAINWFREDDQKVTCSMGFASFPLVQFSFEDWQASLNLADHALYQVKNSGKNDWFGFELATSEIDYQQLNNIDDLIQTRQLRKVKSENDEV